MSSVATVKAMVKRALGPFGTRCVGAGLYGARRAGQRLAYWTWSRHVVDADGVPVWFDTCRPETLAYFVPRIAGGRMHEPAVSRRLIEHVTRSSVFLDVGCNIGYYSALVAVLAVEGEVHAFDVQERCLTAALANVRANEPTARFFGTLAAVGGSDGRRVAVGAGGAASSDLRTDDPANKNARSQLYVVGQTLDAYVEGNALSRVDLVKIDVEGGEEAVLSGATRTLARHRPTLFVEVHPHKGGDLRAVAGALLGQGYGVEMIRQRKSQSRSSVHAIARVEDIVEVPARDVVLYARPTEQEPTRGGAGEAPGAHK